MGGNCRDGLHLCQYFPTAALSASGGSPNFHSHLIETTRRRSLNPTATGRNNKNQRKEERDSLVLCKHTAARCAVIQRLFPLLLLSTWKLDTEAFHHFSCCQKILTVDASISMTDGSACCCPKVFLGLLSTDCRPNLKHTCFIQMDVATGNFHHLFLLE